MYGPSSSMVDDYTAERRKTERKKFFVCFTSSGPTTKREEVLCEK